MAIAELAYCSNAEATSDRNTSVASMATKSSEDGESEGERSNIELCDGRVDHWYAEPGAVSGVVVVLRFDSGDPGAGTNVQPEFEVGSL